MMASVADADAPHIDVAVGIEAVDLLHETGGRRVRAFIATEICGADYDTRTTPASAAVRMAMSVIMVMSVATPAMPVSVIAVAMVLGGVMAAVVPPLVAALGLGGGADAECRHERCYDCDCDLLHLRLHGEITAGSTSSEITLNVK